MAARARRLMAVGVVGVWVGVVGAGLLGCQSYTRDADVLAEVRAGEFGAARLVAQNRASRDPSDRSFMLDRVKVMLLAQADGVPWAAEPTVDRMYDFLRTQGVNRDNTVASFFIGEGGARVWKGEPFEQAMAYHAIATFDATRGDWGNARAGAINSLFAVRDFSTTLASRARAAGAGGGGASRAAWQSDPDTMERVALVEEAARAERAGERDALARYAAQASDFEVGYAMRAIASTQVGFAEDAAEAARTMVAIRPELGGLASRITSGRYNAVFVVEYGLGPRKEAAGPDGAIAVFRPVTASDGTLLRVVVNGREEQFPVVTDVNRLARDIRWNNLEDVRRAKSLIGDAILVGGVAVAAGAENDEAKIAGAAAAIAGLLLKATASADTRHNEVLAQRVYIAPVMLEPGLNRVEVALADGRGRLVLPAVAGPPPGRTFAHYVRLPESAGAWATSGVVRYSTDATGPVDESVAARVPWILGGLCVRTPSEAALRDYQSAGVLREVSLQDLVDLYREEGIWVEGNSLEGGPRRHILEGGNSLFTPEAGSAGFVRLYGQTHAAYVPRSARVRELASAISVERAGGLSVGGVSGGVDGGGDAGVGVEGRE